MTWVEVLVRKNEQPLTLEEMRKWVLGLEKLMRRLEGLRP